MPIVIISESKELPAWRDALAQNLPETVIDVYPDLSLPPEAYTFAACWRQPWGVLDKFSGLLAASSMGAGYEHLVNDPGLRPTADLLRIESSKLTQAVARYICAAVINHQKSFFQHTRSPDWLTGHKTDPELTVGIAGMGRIGQCTAKALVQLGMRVNGYNRSPIALDGVKYFPTEAWIDFLGSSDVVASVLPANDATIGIFDHEAFMAMPKGGFFINVGRGSCVAEEDLLRAIDCGHLSGACLDVLQKEPPPIGHPFIDHEKIWLTPHVAGITDVVEGAACLAENYRRVQAGLTTLGKVKR